MSTKYRPAPILVMFLSILAAAAFAQEVKPESAASRSNLIVLPIVFHSPETRWGGGAGGLWTWGLDRYGSRPSMLTFSAVYTEKAQFTLEIKPEIFLGDGSTILSGNLEVRDYPSSFYGIGNDAPFDAGEGFTPRHVFAKISLERKLFSGSPLYGGVAYSYDHYSFRPFEPEGRLSAGTILGSRGGSVSGFGLGLRWDTRDGVFYPKRGQFVQAWFDVRSAAFGSDYDYMKWKTDARAYFSLGGNRVLAFQGLLIGAGVGTPFMALPRLGGSETLRGYNSERFRDRWLAEAQAEVRVPLFWKLGFNAFAGVGRVAASFGGLKPDGFKFAAGWGLRLKLNAEGACLRVDFGYGRGVSEMYLSAGEAF